MTAGCCAACQEAQLQLGIRCGAGVIAHVVDPQHRSRSDAECQCDREERRRFHFGTQHAELLPRCAQLMKSSRLRAQVRIELAKERAF
jgi:hypothetical protein